MSHSWLLIVNLSLVACSTVPITIPEPVVPITPETVPVDVCKLEVIGYASPETIAGAKAGCIQLYGPDFCLIKLEEKGKDNYHAICRDRKNPGPGVQ